MSLKTAKNCLRECKALKKNVIFVDRGSSLRSTNLNKHNRSAKRKCIG